jgi:hypothetical protein
MMTAALLSKWGIVDHPANPPTAGRIPKTLAYLIYYALDMAYIETPTLMEKKQTFYTETILHNIRDGSSGECDTGNAYRSKKPYS